ncbi:hypothetical protein Hdeb2414_s0023g00630701 [Helianthus debilis subsp. tardiflorus]
MYIYVCVYSVLHHLNKGYQCKVVTFLCVEDDSYVWKRVSDLVLYFASARIDGQLCFVGLDIVMDIKQPTLMKSSNVDGNVEADKMFVDDHFQKLINISDETRNVCNKACVFEELFRGLPNLIMSSIESAKVNRLC